MYYVSGALHVKTLSKCLLPTPCNDVPYRSHSTTSISFPHNWLSASQLDN